MLKTILAFISVALLSCQAAATVVEIRTNMGTISVNLFDEDTPETVENFLEYVNSGAYANNVVHRLETDFVIQAGGFQYNNELPLDNVATGVPVVNEPELSNVRGTIAMAKLAGDPNSATSQWYINLADNSQNLDVQNGGFTVFGQVIGDGMNIVDQISELPRFNLGGAATSIPLNNYSEDDAANGVDPDEENFVLITDIVVTDSATVTNPDLNPTPNTLINSGNGGGSDNPSDGGSSGGALNPLLLIMLSLPALLLRRRQKS
ncbi:peptidylprolyl isomerase [Planctobacterium marinum]|uniref:peptidylprolyl isomerase n=1 Tax=Planctobacterium marinum TaxID=1631968 RepID=UPI001E3AD90D|nr:peptidylprolyl isomerase [Planctobacterium marinum]MCC2606766.1 peptidylprolyl isomerase [Planctobacterium marinum]